MQTYIISDHAPTSHRVRQALLGQGQECPADHILPMQGATERLAQTPADLLAIVLPPDPTRSLGVLSDLRLLSPARMLVVGPASDSRLVLQALRAGAADYIDEADLEAAVLQIAAYRIHHDEVARVADVEVIVNRRAAIVHGHRWRVQRRKVFPLAGGAVVDLESHRVTEHSKAPIECQENSGTTAIRTVKGSGS